MSYIKSPINYTGNKYRILDQITPYFPEKINTFVDLFCGGATVGFNVEADNIILIDSNEKIINLLKFLAQNNINNTIEQVESLINNYGLSYSYKNGYSYYKDLGYVDGNNGLKNYNKDGYYKLRNDYNSLKNKTSKKANIMLYTLMVYAFNNDIRFNNNGEFNLPVGKTDFNKNNYNKLIDFYDRAKHINYKFICADFNSKEVKDILLDADYVYCDPPYLITTAVYNENNGWSENKEEELLNLLQYAHENGKMFALSNVLTKTGKTNSLLKNWIENNNYNKIPINYHYRSASYNKKNRDSSEEEVLVVNAVAMA